MIPKMGKPGMLQALEAALSRGERPGMHPMMQEVWPTGLDEAAIPAAKAEMARPSLNADAPLPTAYGDELGNAMFDASLTPGSGVSREQLRGMSIEAPPDPRFEAYLAELTQDPGAREEHYVDLLQSRLGRRLSDEELRTVLDQMMPF